MTGIEMEILIAEGAFFGAVLGRFFKVLVLMPAGAVAIALLLVRREVAGHTVLDSFLGIGLLIASLELGYVTGLISTDISAAAQGFRGFLARFRRRHRRACPMLRAGNVRRALFTSAMRERDPIRWNGITRKALFPMLYNAKPGGTFVDHARATLRAARSQPGQSLVY